MRRAVAMPLLAGALALTACSEDPPAGQVLATVNGVEITVAELKEEAQSRGLDIDDRSLRDALVRELVERKLLVEQARQQGIDRTPQFLLAERRQREILLAQQLLTLPAQAQTFSPEQLNAFIASHPRSFDGRVVAQADQLAVSGDLALPLRALLAQATSVDRMAELLRQAGLTATRTRESWDSADPATPLGSAEVAPKAGTRFMLQRPGRTILGLVTAVQPSPVPADQRTATAAALMQRSLAERRMRSLLDRAATSARIAYNPEFDPRAGAPEGAAGPPRPHR